MAKVAFIMAASHSGSTLLAMLLGAHPQATTIGDTAGTPDRNNPDYCCSCGCKARKCPFWLGIIDQMRSQGFDLDIADFGTRVEYPESRFIDRVLRAEYRGPILEAVRDSFLLLSARWRRQFQIIAKRNLALFETVVNSTNSKILIDSSKQPHRLKFLLQIPELAVKVIHLVRDGRGVAHTYIQDNGWPVEKAAMEWQRSVVSAKNLLARLDRNMWIQIRYEDLCADPQAELEKLCVFLDLDPSRVNLNFRSSGLHVFGNKMRLSSEQAIRLDEKWQSELTDLQVSTIEHLATRQLTRYGYSVNGI